MTESYLSPDSPSGRDLSRKLNITHLYFITVASMIGSGIFTTSGFILGYVHNTWLMLLTWIVGGFIALAGALCYGELGAMFPVSGGDYIFLREGLGRRVAFLSGWVSLWVGFSAPIAACSIAFGKYMMQVFPSSQGLFSDKGPLILAIGAICWFAFTHSKGILFGARMQNLFVILEVFFIISLIALGFLSDNGSWTHLDAAPEIKNSFGGTFATSLIFVSFAYSGWNASAYLGGEVQNPQKNIPRAIFLGCGTVMILYFLLNLIFIYAIPSSKMKDVAEIGALACTQLFGATTGKFCTLLIAFCLLSTIGAMMMTGPRIYVAMANDGIFFRFFSIVKPHSRSPQNAIYLQALIAAGMALTSTFNALLIYIGFVLAIFSSLTVIGLMWLRRTLPDRERPYKVWGYPWTPLLFVCFNLWIVTYCVSNTPQASIWGGVTIVTGCLAYEFFLKNQRRSALLGKDIVP